MLSLDQLDDSTRAILDENGFDAIPFETLAESVARDGLDPDRNRIEGELELPPDGALTRLPQEGEAAGARLAEIGRAAIDAGQVGVVVLNGGMATRFGGAPKGATEAIRGRSFLDLKLSQVVRAGGGRVPVLLMSSFATDAPTREHLRTLDFDLDVRLFNQLVSLRLAPDGQLFLGSDGAPSLHAPGHGDLPFALVRSGEFARFVDGGGRYLTVSNVDNLAAGLDARVIGAHIAQGRPITVELVATRPGDVGGFPARVDGRLAIVEAFRLPESFDVDTIPVFNTNTFVFDAAALAGAPDLTWFAVVKTVDGREAVQFERLVGQLTEGHETTWLEVPREGAASRFVPIKVPEDLVSERDALEAVLRAQGVL